MSNQPCQVKIKKPSGLSKYNSDGYILVGDQRMYQPIFMTTNERGNKTKFQTSNLSVDMHSGISPVLAKYFNLNSASKYKSLFTSHNDLTGFGDSVPHIYGSNPVLINEKINFISENLNLPKLSWKPKTLSLKKAYQRRINNSKSIGDHLNKSLKSYE